MLIGTADMTSHLILHLVQAPLLIRLLFLSSFWIFLFFFPKQFNSLCSIRQFGSKINAIIIIIIIIIIMMYPFMNSGKELLTKMEELLASGIPLHMLVPAFALVSSFHPSY